MKRELFAILLLATILFTSVWNIRRIDRMTDELLDGLAYSAAAAEAGDCETAAERLNAVLAHWKAMDHYTGIVLRHTETDTCTDLFYELLGELQQGCTGRAKGLYESLTEHLQSIAEMEHPTLKSVF